MKKVNVKTRLFLLLTIGAGILSTAATAATLAAYQDGSSSSNKGAYEVLSGITAGELQFGSHTNLSGSHLNLTKAVYGNKNVIRHRSDATLSIDKIGTIGAAGNISGAGLTFNLSTTSSPDAMSLQTLSFDWTYGISTPNSSTALTTVNFASRTFDVGYSVYYSTDGGTSWNFVQSRQETFDFTGQTGNHYMSDYGTQTISLNGIPNADDVTFSVVFFDNNPDDSTSNGGQRAGLAQHTMLNLAVDGSIVVVPEPASAAFGMFGLAALLIRRKR